IWFRPFEWLDVQKIKYWERYFWKAADRVVAVSEEDAKIMRSMVAGLRVDVVPNGVGEDFGGLSKKLHFNHTILYMANYKWIQNWEAVELLARQVFPLIKEKIKDAKLLIAGQYPTAQVKSLGVGDIEILELKDDDSKGVVDSYLKSGLLVAPMYARGGSRLKILAAMASMVPVVTTPVGAEGYGAIDGESILIGKTNEELAQKAIQVFTDRKLYTKVAKNARELVDSRFSWGPISKKLESIYGEIINSHP
ncbi:glycosyltransferase, partial [Candidatus Woesebacteria bacterium]|nr:glycosyltransferase [Candidatus Woesebacteria bacterium]